MYYIYWHRRLLFSLVEASSVRFLQLACRMSEDVYVNLLTWGDVGLAVASFPSSMDSSTVVRGNRINVSSWLWSYKVQRFFICVTCYIRPLQICSIQCPAAFLRDIVTLWCDTIRCATCQYLTSDIDSRRAARLVQRTTSKKVNKIKIKKKPVSRKKSDWLIK